MALNDEQFGYNTYDLIEKKYEELVINIVNEIIRLNIDRLAPEDSPRKNTWEDYCYYPQFANGLYSELYENMFSGICTSEIAKLSEFEICLMWLNSEEIEEWIDENHEWKINFPQSSEIKNMVIDELMRRLRQYGEGDDIPLE
jgi:hypothetical protein